MIPDIPTYNPLDYTLYGIVQFVSIVDWSQTRYIAKNPDKFKEANPIIGSNPTVGKVNGHFTARITLQHLAVSYLPPAYRTPVLGTLATVYTGVVVHNHLLGVKQDYGSDKSKHFIAGALTGYVFKGLTDSKKLGCQASIGIGLAKELYDHLSSKGKPEWKDLIFTSVGGCTISYFDGITIAPSKITYQTSLNIL